MPEFTSEKLATPIKLDLKHLENLWSLMPDKNKSIAFLDDSIEYTETSLEAALKTMEKLKLSSIRSKNNLCLKCDSMEIYFSNPPVLKICSDFEDHTDTLIRIRRILSRGNSSSDIVAYDGTTFRTVYLIVLGMLICHLMYQTRFPDTIDELPIWLVCMTCIVVWLYIFDRPSEFEPVFISVSNGNCLNGLWEKILSAVRWLTKSLVTITLMVIAALVADYLIKR